MSWFNYSGKPSHPLIVTRGHYQPLDVHTAAPPRAGIELHMLYANCRITWDAASGNRPRYGRIRVKYVRDDGDATGYQDWQVIDGPGTDIFLVQPMHWEQGESGKGGRWHIRCEGDIARLDVTTRYAKAAVLG